jgi:hypothetical protein
MESRTHARFHTKWLNNTATACASIINSDTTLSSTTYIGGLIAVPCVVPLPCTVTAAAISISTVTLITKRCGVVMYTG